MKLPVLARTTLVSFLAAALVVLPATARAELVRTDQLAASSAQASAAKGAQAREVLYSWLDRADVQAELERLGVPADEARARIEALSDAELASVAGHVADLPAGGFVGAIIAAILIVFLVLLLTDILGLTDVFPFVRKPHRR